MRQPLIAGAKHDAALLLHASNWSDPRIAAAISSNIRSVFQWRHNQGLPPVVRCNGHALRNARALYERGLSDGQIARECGCTQSAATKWRQRKGLPPHTERILIAPEVRQAIRKCLFAGLAARDVAKGFGISTVSVQRIRNEIGDDPRLLQHGERSKAATLPRYKSGRRIPRLSSSAFKIALPAWAEGKNDSEIAALVGKDRTAICAWRTCYGLSPNRAPASAPNRPVSAPISPHSNALYRRASAAVPLSVPPDLRQDAVGDIIVAVLAGELPEDRIEAEAPRFLSSVFRRFASPFGDLSLDAERGEEGATLMDTLPCQQAQAAFDLALYRGLYGESAFQIA